MVTRRLMETNRLIQEDIDDHFLGEEELSLNEMKEE